VTYVIEPSSIQQSFSCIFQVALVCSSTMKAQTDASYIMYQ